MDFVIVLAVLLCFSGVTYLSLGARLLVRYSESMKRPIGLAAVVLGFWVLGGALEMLAWTDAAFAAGRMGYFVGTALFPLAVLMFVRDYTGARTSRLAVAALLVVPFCSLAIAATNTWHELMWYLPNAEESVAYLTRPAAWGPWYLLLHAPYGCALILSALAMLLMHSTAVGAGHRRALLLLAMGAVLPVIAVAAYELGVGSAETSFVPIVLAAMLPVYAWMIVGEQLIEFTPIAYETVFQHMQDPVVVLDNERRVIGLNRGAESLLKLEETDALKESLETLFGDEATEVFDALDSGEPRKMMTTTGRFLHVQVSPIDRNSGGHAGRVLMFRDVSDVERAQQEVRNSERLLRTLVDHSVNGIVRLRWEADSGQKQRLRCVFANSAAAGFLNIDAEELIGYTFDELIAVASSGMQLDEAATVLQDVQTAVELGDIVDVDVRVGSDADGRWLHVIGEAVGEEVAVTFVDITDKKAKQLQMESIAWTDPLTGVLNRRGFERDAAGRLTASADDATGALMFVDLNEFKQINDSFGHEVGDELLRVAAQRLKTSLRPGDIIGRPGGDEFVALIPDVDSDEAQQLAERLMETLRQAYRIQGQSLHCSASIGLALYPTNANTLTGLLRAADQAMYRAKARAHEETGRVRLLERAI